MPVCLLDCETSFSVEQNEISNYNGIHIVVTKD